jgi:uncharacterized membrane protein (UPF0127 family)
MKIINKSNQKIIANNVKVADKFFSRFIGLINRSSIEENEGLWLVPCSSIHSIGMRFDFDAVFLDKSDKIIFLIKNMPPFKVAPLVSNTYSVLELPSGTIDCTGINIDDILEFYD